MAKKTWRPEGWETVAPGLRLYKGQPLRNTRHAFETGADAMLEALRKQGIDHKVYADHLRFGLDRGKKVIEGKEDTVTYQGVKGNLVFIPDDGR